MQIIGFNLNKVSAQRTEKILKSQKNIDFEFTDFQKEKVALLKDKEPYKVDFTHNITYQDLESKKEDKKGEIAFEGNIVLALEKEEVKEMTKAWKKKQIPPQVRLTLSNVILRKCTPRAVQLQEEVGLPSHIPFPRIEAQKQ